MTSISAQPYFGSGGSHPYDQALQVGGVLTLRDVNGTLETLMDVGRFAAPADDADLSVLTRANGAIIDLGCGPGRMVQAAIMTGRFAFGIDVSPTAVAVANRAGLPVLEHDINDVLPLEGKWGTALLLDGNIGIGGDPKALLSRVWDIVTDTGFIIVETSADEHEEEYFLAEVSDELGRFSGSFPWAQIGSRALLRIAAEAGLNCVEMWSHESAPGNVGAGSGPRTFVALSSRL